MPPDRSIELRDSGVGSTEPLLVGKRVAAVMLLSGATTSYIGALTVPMPAMAQGTQLLLAVGLTLLGGFIAATRPREYVLQAGVLWAVLTVSGMLATADEFGTTPFFYLWPAVFAAYFSSTRFLALTLITLVASLLGALVISELVWAVKADILIGTTVSTGLMAGLVAIMHGRNERLTSQLALAAHTDPLTALLNRRGLDLQFAAVLDEAAGRSQPLAVVMFDLDSFKRFNDVHGHMVGDGALRRVACILDEHSRPVDLVCRFGGEEFAVVLPGVGVDEARSYAERVAWALGVEKVDPNLRITTSSGIACVESAADTVSDLLARADRALYAAKAAGRARAAWSFDGTIEVGDRIDVPQLHTVPTELPARARGTLLRQARRPATDDAGPGELRATA